MSGFPILGVGDKVRLTFEGEVYSLEGGHAHLRVNEDPSDPDQFCCQMFRNDCLASVEVVERNVYDMSFEEATGALRRGKVVLCDGDPSYEFRVGETGYLEYGLPNVRSIWQREHNWFSWSDRAFRIVEDVSDATPAQPAGTVVVPPEIVKALDEALRVMVETARKVLAGRETGEVVE